MYIYLAPDCVTATLQGRCGPDLHEEIEHALDRTLSFFEPGYHFAVEYKRGLWDGKRHLLKRPKATGKLTFPAGLIGRAVTTLREELHLDMQVVDDRPEWPYGHALALRPTPRLRGIDSLFPDQEVALRAFLHDPRGCLQLPTAFGKTELAAALIAVIKPHPVLFIVDRKGLMSQTAQRLEERLGEVVNLAGGGHLQVHPASKRRVTVATIQTLWHHRAKLSQQFFPSLQAVIVDEAHSISPHTWFRVLAKIPAPIRLGLSATIREASRRLIVEAYLGPLLHEQSALSLIESERIAEPIIGMLTVGGTVHDTDDPYVAGIVRNELRNNLIVTALSEARARHWPALVLVVRIEHGTRLNAQCHLAGLASKFIHGQTPLDEINRAKRELESGKIHTLIASTIFDKGQDIPAIRFLVLGGAQRSALLQIQRSGRALRKKPGDNRVHILDFMDQSHSQLHNQATHRFTTFRRKGYTVKVIATLGELFL